MSVNLIHASMAMGLQNLQNEPQRLKKEAEEIKEELESLVIDNYRIFVDNLTCSSHLRNEDKKIENSASNMEEQLALLSRQCTDFREKVSSFVTAHKRNRKTLEHHIQLVELLEIPQLVDACVRNRFYEEALELANFVNGLERRHLLVSEFRTSGLEGSEEGAGEGGAGKGVIQSIVNDVHVILRALRQQLLATLLSDNSLPKELELLGIVRKLNSLVIDRQFNVNRHHSSKFSQMEEGQREELRRHLTMSSETQLQLEFLEASSAWLARKMEAVEANSSGVVNVSASPSEMESMDGGGTSSSSSQSQSAFSRAMEIIELQRSSWFGTITHFNALFSASESLQPPGASLGAWAVQQVEDLLARLATLLPLIEEGASLRNVLDQTLFFSDRLAQVGCDFSGLVLVSFESNMMRRVHTDCESALRSFKRLLKTERVVTEVDETTKEQLVPAFVRPAATLAGAVGDTPTKARPSVGDLAAPAGLMQYPPLAYLLNALLRVLNFVRDCALVSAYDRVETCLGQCLDSACQALAANTARVRERGERYSSDLGERSASLDVLYKRAMTSMLVPHVLRCLSLVFPAASQSQTTDKQQDSSDLQELTPTLKLIVARCSDTLNAME